MRSLLLARLLPTASALLFCLASPASADPLTVDAGWHEFSWNDAPNAFADNGPFEFTTLHLATLLVTDAYLNGDRFEVYDNGVLLGATSLPTDDGTQIEGDPDAAVVSADFSSGAFVLGAGFHSITIKTIDIAAEYTSGAGFLRVDSLDGGGGAVPRETPEPGTLTLLGLAATCLVGRYGWRRRAA
jgi:hypothetical protein